MFEASFDMVYKNDEETVQQILTKLYINKTKQEFSIGVLEPNKTYKVTECVLSVPKGCVTYEYCCDECGCVLSFPHLFIFQHHIPPNTDYCLNCVKLIDDEERERLKSRSLRELFLRGLKPLLTFVTAHHGCLLEPTIENFRLRHSEEEEMVDSGSSSIDDESTVWSQTDESTSSSSRSSSSRSGSNSNSTDDQESDTPSESEESSDNMEEEGSKRQTVCLYNYESQERVYCGLGECLNWTLQYLRAPSYSLHHQ